MVTGRMRKMVCPVMKRESKGGGLDQTWRSKVMVTGCQMIMEFKDGSVGCFAEGFERERVRKWVIKD